MGARQLIADAITRQGLSQRDVARLAGLSQSQVSRYLSGDRDLMGRSLEDLMSALGYQVHPRHARKQSRPVGTARRRLALLPSKIRYAAPPK